MPEKEYIEREAADKELCAFIHELNRACASAESSAVFEALARIRYLPAADVEPVRRGEWEQEDLAPTRWKFCSCCGFANSRNSKWNYCPDCGAKMDGGDT